ncbi:50S ribosomal protein L15 [Candidatus Kaiserbacteria bacterium]|nr:50S ribosomal protein L15 [Candidatus Kaiserbacteria bacterium]
MSLHTLKRMTKRAYRRVGRGQSSTRGKTSGRGGKGQTARAGHKARPELRDIIKKLPKRRGYGKNRARTVNATRMRAFPVPLEALEATFAAGQDVSPATLAERNVIPMYSGKPMHAKILGDGALTKKLSIKGCMVSKSARTAIEKAGGTIA